MQLDLMLHLDILMSVIPVPRLVFLNEGRTIGHERLPNNVSAMQSYFKVVLVVHC